MLFREYGPKALIRHQKSWWALVPAGSPANHWPDGTKVNWLPEPAQVHLWDFSGFVRWSFTLQLGAVEWNQPIQGLRGPTVRLVPVKRESWNDQWEWFNRYQKQPPFVKKVILWQLWEGQALSEREHWFSWWHLNAQAVNWGWLIWWQWGPSEGFYGLTPETLWYRDSEGQLVVPGIGGSRPRLSELTHSVPDFLRWEHVLIQQDIEQKLSRLALPGGRWVRQSQVSVIPSLGVEHWLSQWRWEPDESSQIIRPSLKWLWVLHPTAAIGYLSHQPAKREFLKQLPQPPVALWRGVLWIDHPQLQVALVLIRMVFWDRTKSQLPIGVGVTADHDPEDQAQEAFWKASGLAHALGWEISS